MCVKLRFLMGMETDLAVRWKFGETQSNAKVIEAAARLIADQTRPSKIILFGSRAQDDDVDGDVDFLVIKRQVVRRRSEIVELLRLLKPLRIPADILLYSEDEVDEGSQVLGSVLNDALSKGKVMYEAS